MFAYMRIQLKTIPVSITNKGERYNLYKGSFVLDFILSES